MVCREMRWKRKMSRAMGTGLLEEVQQANPVLNHLSHHQAHGARPQVDHRLR